MTTSIDRDIELAELIRLASARIKELQEKVEDLEERVRWLEPYE